MMDEREELENRVNRGKMGNLASRVRRDCKVFQDSKDLQETEEHRVSQEMRVELVPLVLQGALVRGAATEKLGHLENLDCWVWLVRKEREVTGAPKDSRDCREVLD